MAADSGEGAEGSVVEHDEIVKRLLDYQEQLRDEEAAGASGQTATDEVVDVAAAEAGAEPVTTAALEDLRLRLARLEAALVDLAGKVHALRVQAQESAIAIDEQLAEIQDLLFRAPHPPTDAI